MIITNPIIEPDSRIDFYAGSIDALEQLQSIYNALEEGRRGVFYASPSVVFHANNIPLVRIANRLHGYNPLVICNYRDLNATFYMGDERPFIMIENEYNRDSRGLLKVVSLILCRERRTYDMRRSTNRDVEMFDDTEQAVAKLLQFIKGKEVKYIDSIGNHSIGIIYMSFGDKVNDAIRKSQASLKRLGYEYPVTIVGDFPNKPSADAMPSKYNHIQWDGQSPYDLSQRKNFKFRAGRVKPWLYELSPYDYTLYIDADTQFIRGIEDGFHYLQKNDICVTEEKLTLQQLYNKKLAGWEINLIERDATIIELYSDGSDKFINSGVLFFKKSQKVRKLFANWYEEWLRFQEWDEQLALMRAIYKTKVKVKYLDYHWNNPFPDETSYIFHNYGRGSVRSEPA
jgi:hypothetical protein